MSHRICGKFPYMSHPISGHVTANFRTCHTQFPFKSQLISDMSTPNFQSYVTSSAVVHKCFPGVLDTHNKLLVDWLYSILTDCPTYVSSNWPRSRLYLNLSGTVIGTEYRKSLTKFTRCLLNFDNHSRNAVLILENQFFDEDLTVTKREKVHIFAHASWGRNDPLDGLEYPPF